MLKIAAAEVQETSYIAPVIQCGHSRLNHYFTRTNVRLLIQYISNYGILKLTR